ncbi:GNAT family N-acetyltransferase [Flammeovirga kamogawensis]|uniref:GNAT family N-acetyltransferase n=1 Tax=Flammeovirga kamogawensis TaxID=373891 RepID=A0ABX8GWW8_9BACT|nr:GNAT family N-acetyltransferase [Flammeovirga kamogawensis]MBB6460741.1 dTDP-4-amino-4,6-dideoxy-D-galactose acyltransferase [Flammeovirga kamogawensis]QWG08094.1 GNAT family N-acetyltransferase [Flammeovirga kamogawensis]TRX69898.1 GNAT family N-acetyltransferase [Flammeovirga kamogawensis]
MEKLNWDSNFFNLEVFKANYYSGIENDLNGNFDLLYLYSDKLIDKSGFKQTIQLVDKKVTFKKDIVKNKIINSETIYSVNSVNEKLFSLAIQSSEFSRFRIDNKIDNKKVDELYQLWIENSINRKIAFDVLSFGSENYGVITLSKKNDIAGIGLLAVDTAIRGKGIGKLLIKQTENICVEKGYKELQVVTQLDNNLACKFYESQNFLIDKIEYIYHLWNK